MKLIVLGTQIGVVCSVCDGLYLLCDVCDALFGEPTLQKKR